MSARTQQQLPQSRNPRASSSVLSASLGPSEAPRASLAPACGLDARARIGQPSHTCPPYRCTSKIPPSRISFALPPSPPYTNPHFRRGIPLPLLDEKARAMLHKEDEDDKHQAPLLLRRDPTLLSPPYSPHRRPLVHLNEEEESVSIERVDPIEHRNPFEVESGGLPSEEANGALSEGDPSLSRPSGSLNLNLFGQHLTFDDAHPLPASPSPRMHTQTLPSIDVIRGNGLREQEQERDPLFKPSDFDVFENDWDTIPSRSSHGTSPPSSSVSSPDSNSNTQDFHPFDFHAQDFASSSKSPPNSPSRRSVVDLPNEYPSSSSSLLDPPPEMLIEHGDELEWGRRLEEQQHIPPQGHTFSDRTSNLFDDPPSHLLDSPFQAPLVLGSQGITFPPTRSLLFSPPEPEDIPLPDSPEDRLIYLTDGYSEIAAEQNEEESRIRALHMQMIAAEAQSRNRESLLSDYITKLFATIPTPPPREPTPTPILVHQQKRKDEIVVTDDGFYQYREEQKSGHAHDDQAPPPSSATVASDLPPSLTAPEPLLRHEYDQHISEIEAENTLELIQQRTRELQTAISARANERRLRKRAKERARELGALLTLKVAQSHSDAWNTAARQALARSQTQETIVVSASGSGFHTSDSSVLSSTLTERHHGSARKRKSTGDAHAEILQLVAKMILRRRDSQRPLNGKSIRLVGQRHIRSSLSREILGDDEDIKPKREDVGSFEDDFDILENGPQLSDI